jgi:hypothetical protein
MVRMRSSVRFRLRAPVKRILETLISQCFKVFVCSFLLFQFLLSILAEYLLIKIVYDKLVEFHIPLGYFNYFFLIE